MISGTSSTTSSFPICTASSRRPAGRTPSNTRIGEIFGEIKNKIQSGYNLREIIDHIDELRFRSQTEKHVSRTDFFRH